MEDAIRNVGENIRWAISKVSQKTAEKKKRYFSNAKKGEFAEIKNKLLSSKANVQREALRKIIAFTTMGKDMSGMFFSVMKCIQSIDKEVKRLAYLYLIYYAKSKPGLAILAVNTFYRDMISDSSLVRRMAIRSVGSMHSKELSPYLLDFLQNGITDADVYVQQAAVYAVAKLYTTVPELIKDYGMIDSVLSLLNEGSPSVVPVCISVLESVGRENTMTIDYVEILDTNYLSSTLKNLGPWGKLGILDGLYKKSDIMPLVEKLKLVDMCDGMLKKADNIALIMVLCRILLKCVESFRGLASFDDCEVGVGITPQELETTLINNISTALLMYHPKQPEQFFILLKSIKTLITAYPGYINDPRPFFCKYNEATHIKLEKLAILLFIANEDTSEQILKEIDGYAHEPDIEFSSAATVGIADLLFAVPGIFKKCIAVLNQIAMQKNTPVHIQESTIITIQRILVHYGYIPELELSRIIGAIHILANPQARKAAIWILGEFCYLIEGAATWLMHLSESLTYEETDVQHEIITSTVKIYLSLPDESKELVEGLLMEATKIRRPEVNNRAMFFWRLLSEEPFLAKKIIFNNRTPEKLSNNDESMQNTNISYTTMLGMSSSLFRKTFDTVDSENKFSLSQIRLLDHETYEFEDDDGNPFSQWEDEAGPEKSSDTKQIIDLL